jgi:Mrp family chromosome partitioning ATPase
VWATTRRIDEIDEPLGPRLSLTDSHHPAAGALQQMLYRSTGASSTTMIVDMPPETGDAQLTMAQQVPLAGAVIVSTPQDIAFVDVRKGLNMFTKVDVQVFGIIENMSHTVRRVSPSSGGHLV